MSSEPQPYTSFGSAPELDGAVAWLNCASPLTLKQLRGKIVLVDFWTYCCINCMHVLQDIAYLEQRYPNVLAVVGVHSAKFPNERATANLELAIRRSEIRHPVANDAEFRIWKAYGARAWPTLCLIDPLGEVVAAYSGEGHLPDLDRAIEQLVDYHRDTGTLVETPLAYAIQTPKDDGNSLLFPGKVLADSASNRLFISDSNHNRIVICDLSGKVVDVVGSGEVGLSDGTFGDARLYRPQGMALSRNTLFVADTENHAIRTVDLGDRTVSTFGGNGVQGSFRNMVSGPNALLSSPWALAVVDNMLYIAMAGTHQIWRAAVESRNFRLYAGSGIENLADGPSPSAQFAQPCGLAIANKMLYIADSEVSAIRRIDLTGDLVETLVGTGLFESGDAIGVSQFAQLQHPMDVCWHDGKVFIADTYNHRVKVLIPSTQSVEHLVGTGSPAGGSTGLFEPGGVSVANGYVYIADTNNHRIVRVSLERPAIEEVPIRF